jgi:hypothetical protein
MYGVDTGYEIVKLGPVALRARLGLGNYTVTMTSGFWGVTKASSLYVDPGLAAMLAFGQFFVGANANVIWLTGSPVVYGFGGPPNVAFTGNGEVGVKF